MKRPLFYSLVLVCAFSLTAFTQTPATPAAPPDSAEVLQRRLEALQKRMQDWPQLNRYRDANAQVAVPAQDEKRVVFFGDSITDGWKIAEFFPGKPYVNRGISGQTTPQMLIRMQPDVIARKPKAMLLLAGTNDIAGNTGPMTNEMIQDNYTAIAQLAQANGIKMIFASVLPVHDYNPQRKMTTGRPPERILALNNWLKAYCQKNGHIYLDYFSKMVDDKGFLKAELANDGLHPNAEGYKIMAPLAEAAIAQALK
ncbi:MAG: capsular biosynthesis protein [Acidobacteria bacterium]|nr:capsular biosynthesis protein [Acidobacteriota bacterium]